MKYKKTVLNITMVLILMASLNAAGQGRGGSRGGQGQQPPPPAIDTALDFDGDGTISADEIANVPTTLIELDGDNNGGLTFTECMGFSDREGQQAPSGGQGGSGGQPPAPPIFTALDTSGDGIVDGNEISGAPESLFALDLNGDGALQPDEYMPSRPGGGMGGRPSRSR